MEVNDSDEATGGLQMRKRLGWTIAVLASVVLAGGLGSYLRPDLLVHSAIDHLATDRAVADDVPESRFEVLFCGTGSPSRSLGRRQPCLAIVAGGRLFVFDAGEGSIGALTDYSAPLARLDTVFLTHLHSDHMSGLGELMHNSWLFGRTHAIDVVGPPGTANVVAGFAQVYSEDLVDRQQVVDEQGFDAGLAMATPREVILLDAAPKVVFDRSGVRVEAFAVDHMEWPPAFGYRVHFGGKTLVVSGDTRRSGSVSSAAIGADLLIHEALSEEALSRIGRALDRHDVGVPSSRLEKIAGVHTTTIEVAQLAAAAGVPRLALTHLMPGLPPSWITDRYFLRGMESVYDGDITVARDGMRIRLVQ
jgi:ribonuclease Z